MAKNYSLQMKYLGAIMPRHFEKAIKATIKKGTTDRAPLGTSGDTFILHSLAEADIGFGRSSEVSVRLHNKDAKLLITDKRGGFLFYGGFDNSKFTTEELSEEYYRIFLKVYKHIKK